MIQFVRKHFKGKMARLYIFMLEWGIRIKSLAASIGQREGKKENPAIGKKDLLIVGEKQFIEKVTPGLFGYNNIALLDKTEVTLLKNAISKTSCSEIVFCEGA